MRNTRAKVSNATSTERITWAALLGAFLKPTKKEVGIMISRRHFERRTSVTMAVTRAMLAAGALLVFNLANIAAAAGATNFCRLTSDKALSSCRAGAQSDYLLALAKCDNVSDAAERKACQQQARSDKKDARQSCNDQRDARNSVCKQLGGGRYDPVIDPANFSPTITNQFLPLTPGTTFVYESPTEINEVVVTNNTKQILDATCREVHDTVKLKPSLELTEDTLDWFCQDVLGNVWYFGENTKQLEGGLVVGLEGTWTAGVDGAKPGIAMKANPAIGDFYRQEFLLGVAEDIGEVLSLTETVTVPYNGGTTFNNCVKTKDTSPLEPDVVENKFYCQGIGLVLTVDVNTGVREELVSKTP
jgi:uncharacterized membrane protein